MSNVNHEVQPLEADETVPAGMFDPELTYFADGTPVVMRARGEEKRGVTIGKTVKAGGPYAFQAVRFEDGTTANVAPHVLHRVERKAQTFTFEYNATEGVLIAAALREKAVIERNNAKAYRTNAEIEGTSLVEFYTEQARLADNRAKLLEDAADAIRTPVHAALVEDFTKALPLDDKASHQQVKDAIDLRR